MKNGGLLKIVAIIEITKFYELAINLNSKCLISEYICLVKTNLLACRQGGNL